MQWIKRFIYFHGKRHAGEMGADEATAFLTHLARERDVSASTQNQALSSLPALLARLEGTKWMMASLLYGASKTPARLRLAAALSGGRDQLKAGMPVMARPRIRAWMSWVPS